MARLLLLFTALFAGSAPVFALEPPRPHQQAFLTRTAYADHRLWLLSDSGELSWATPGASHRVVVRLRQPVLDICRQNGHLVVVSARRLVPQTWTIRRRVGRRWVTEAVVPTNGDTLRGIACAAAQVSLLTGRRLVTVSAGRHTALALSGRFRPGRITAIETDGDRLLVGVAAGEWGGGLHTVDRTTGAIAPLEAKLDGSQYCQKPLDGACDPVNAIVPIRDRPGCFAVAVGLIHMLTSGRILRVCGHDVATLYVHLLPQRRGEPKVAEKYRETTAFYGLASLRHGLFAVGNDGLFHIRDDGQASREPLPRFEAIDGIGVSFPDKRIALVLTEVNERVSLGGAVPMLVMR